MSGKPLDLDDQVLIQLQQVIGDKTKHIITVYLAEVPKNIAQMRDALNQHDYKSIMLQAHSLKSSSANVGAMYISQLSAGLELQLEQKNLDNNEVETAINNIQISFDQLQPLFAKYQ